MLQKIKWIGVLLFLMGIIYGTHRLSTSVAVGLEPEKKVIVVDVGHGGADPGKVGINGAKEKDINLAIAKELKRYLEEKGLEVVMTREDDNMLGNTKKEDMVERVNCINRTKTNFAVSIHQNSFSSESEKGAQVFYYKDSVEGKKIAQILQENLRKLSDDNKREIKANTNYYLLKHSKVPTVIVECGFLSNWEESVKLTKEAYQQEIAKNISEGILQYIEQE